LWVVLNALVLPRLVAQGELTAATLGTSALLLAPLALGIAAGEWVHHRLDERRFRVAVAALLLVAGGVLAVGSLKAALRPAPAPAGAESVTKASPADRRCAQVPAASPGVRRSA
jgi:hypothetical protein